MMDLAVYLHISLEDVHNLSLFELELWAARFNSKDNPPLNTALIT